MIVSQLFLSIVLVFLPTASSSPTETDFMAKFSQYEQYLKEFKSKSSLNYGERCHSEEVKTYEIIKSSMNKLSGIPVTSTSLLVAEYEKMGKAMKHLISYVIGYELCNNEKLLTCDKTTHHCSCGVTESFLNQKFSFVRNSNGGCLFAIDSSCLPVNDTPGKHHTCAGGTSCILTNKRGEVLDCDESNYYDVLTTNDKLKVPHCQCKRT